MKIVLAPICVPSGSGGFYMRGAAGIGKTEARFQLSPLDFP